MSSRELLEYHCRFYPEADASEIDCLAEYFELDLKKPITDLSFGNKKKCAIVQVVGVIFGGYFLNAVSKSAEAVEWLGYISPFHYLEFTPLASDYSVNWLGMLAMIVLSGASLFWAFQTFKKKDIEG